MVVKRILIWVWITNGLALTILIVSQQWLIENQKWFSLHTYLLYHQEIIWAPSQ